MFLPLWNNISPRRLYIDMSRRNFALGCLSHRIRRTTRRCSFGGMSGNCRRSLAKYENLNLRPNQMPLLLANWLKFNVTGSPRRCILPFRLGSHAVSAALTLLRVKVCYGVILNVMNGERFNSEFYDCFILGLVQEMLLSRVTNENWTVRRTGLS